MTFSRDEFLAGEAAEPGGEGVRMYMRGLTPAIECEVGGRPLLFTFDTGASSTHVIPIIVRDRLFLYEAGLRLRARGVYVVPVDYPAVPEDAVRFRVALSAAHTRAV